MKRVIYIIGIVLAAIGCAKESSDSSLDQSGMVHFSTVSAVTRVETSTSTEESSIWEKGDEIGINSNNGDSNVEYYVSDIEESSAAIFSPVVAVDQIYLPQSKSVDFSAYYPYQDGSSYISDISTQSDLGEIDFLVSDTLSASYTSTNSVSFTFSHALAMVKFEITLAQDLKDAYPNYVSDFGDYISIKLSNAASKVEYKYDGSYSETVTSDGVITVPVDATAQTATAILNPTGAQQDMTLEISFGNKSYSQALSITPAASTIYEYSITLGYDNITLSSPTIIGWQTALTTPDLGDLTEITFGTPNNPFEIWNAADLAALGSGLYHNGTSEVWDPSAHYKVMASFEITADDNFIGTAISATNPFYGELDGGDFTISGITSFGDPSTLLVSGANSNILGLISYIAPEARVHNLNIVCEISAISADRVSYLGGIAGTNQGTISNCTVSGSITNGYSGTRFIGTGGIAGHSNSLVERCVSSADVSGCWKVGGVVGYLDLNNVVSCGNTGTVTNTHYSGSYTAQQGAGGIVGSGDSGSCVLCCYNNGEVESAGYMTGGIAGYTAGAVIRGCYNTGGVSGAYYYVGYVVGRVLSTSNVVNCYYLIGDDDDDVSYGIGSTDEDVADIVDSKSSSEMQAADFVTTLNTAATSTQTAYSDVTIYKWISGGEDAYPVIDNSVVVANE